MSHDHDHTPSPLQSYMHYPELFGDSWKGFSKFPIKRLADFEGKRVMVSSISSSMYPHDDCFYAVSHFLDVFQ